MWVLTDEYNMYDQEGQYFRAAWTNKPTLKQVKEVLKVHDNDMDEHHILALHILDGGGRRNNEEWWWHLHQVKEGQIF